MFKEKKVFTYTVRLTPQQNNLLEKMAQKMNISRGEVIRKCIEFCAYDSVFWQKR